MAGGGVGSSSLEVTKAGLVFCCDALFLFISPVPSLTPTGAPMSIRIGKGMDVNLAASSPASPTSRHP